MKSKKTNIIAIGGLRNTGKTTIASMSRYSTAAPSFMDNYLCYRPFHKTTIPKYRIISFAEPLKRTLAALFDIDPQKFEDRYFKENTYVYFPTLDITDNPPAHKKLGDNKFTKFLNNNDYSFLNDFYITMRQLLQVFGTNIMRQTFGDNLWVNLTLNNVNKVIISDIRFKTELEALERQKNVFTIYIDRPCCKPGNHQSEKEVVDLYHKEAFDITIHNNGTLKDLYNKVKSLNIK